MRHLATIALTVVVIFASVNFTSAVVGKKVDKYCKQSMGDATTHKVLCRAVANRITLKAYKVCRKGVTWACKGAAASGLVDYKECKPTLLKKICPDVDAMSTTTVAPPGTVEPSEEDETDYSDEEGLEEECEFPGDECDEDYDFFGLMEQTKLLLLSQQRED